MRKTIEFLLTIAACCFVIVQGQKLMDDSREFARRAEQYKQKCDSLVAQGKTYTLFDSDELLSDKPKSRRQENDSVTIAK